MDERYIVKGWVVNAAKGTFRAVLLDFSSNSNDVDHFPATKSIETTVIEKRATSKAILTYNYNLVCNYIYRS
jgi:hypothetical protein